MKQLCVTPYVRICDTMHLSEPTDCTTGRWTAILSTSVHQLYQMHPLTLDRKQCGTKNGQKGYMAFLYFLVSFSWLI